MGIPSGCWFQWDNKCRYFPICKNLMAAITEKAYQGISEAKEKIIPIVPAVDGIIMSTPEISPIIAMFLLNTVLFNIT